MLPSPTPQSKKMKLSNSLRLLFSLLMGVLPLLVANFLFECNAFCNLYKIPLLYGAFVATVLIFLGLFGKTTRYNETGLFLIAFIPVLNFVFIVFGVKVILEEWREVEERVA